MIVRNAEKFNIAQKVGTLHEPVLGDKLNILCDREGGPRVWESDFGLDCERGIDGGPVCLEYRLYLS